MGAFRPDTVVLNWLLTLPFFAAACAGLFPRLSLPAHSEKEAEAMRRGPFMLGALASVMGVALSVSLLPAVFRAGPVTADYWWTKDLYHLRFQADSFTTPLAVVIWGVGLYLNMHLAGLPVLSHPHRRAALLLVAQGGALGACLSADLIALFMFIGLALVALWLLVMLDDARAANRFFAMTHVGALMLLGGILLIWLRGGDSAVTSLSYLLLSVEPNALGVMGLLVLVGTLPMVACFPAYGWLTDLAEAAPSTAMAPALLLPAVGGAMLLRLLPGSMVVALLPALAVVALLLGIATLWWGAIRAWMSPGLRQLAAWLTVAQSGYLVLAIGAMASPTASSEIVRAAALHVLVAPLALAAVWGAAGSVRAEFGTDSIADLNGLLRKAPLATVALFLGGLSLAGLPPLPGFQVQRLLVSGLFHDGRLWFAVVIAAADLLVAVAVLDALRRIWLGEPPTAGRWASAWLSGQLALASLVLLAAGAGSGALAGWTEAVLRGVFSISRSGLVSTP